MWWVLPACHVIMYSLVIKYFPQVVWLNAVTLRLSSVLLNTNLWQLMLIVFISQFSFWKVESVCFLCFCWVTMLPVSHRIFLKFPVEQKIFVLSFGNIVFQLKMFETENSWAMYATLYIYICFYWFSSEFPITSYDLTHILHYFLSSKILLEGLSCSWICVLVLEFGDWSLIQCVNIAVDRYISFESRWLLIWVPATY